MTKTDPEAGAAQLRRLRESRGWSWADLARALRDAARRLTLTSMMDRPVTSIQRTVARWESLSDRTSPGERYQVLLCHVYARTPAGHLSLGQGSDLDTLLDAFRHFGVAPARVRELAEIVARGVEGGLDNPLILLDALVGR